MNPGLESSMLHRIGLVMVLGIVHVVAATDSAKSQDVETTPTWINEPGSVSELPAGERVFLHLTDPALRVRIRSADSSSVELSGLFHHQTESNVIESSVRVWLRCPEDVLRSATEWMRKAQAAHLANEQQTEFNVLLPSDPKFLKQLYDDEVLSVDDRSVTKNEGRSLAFQVYCSGVVQEAKEASGQNQILVSRILIHASPTPLAAHSIQQKLALPGRAFERERSFSVDVIDVKAVGGAKFTDAFHQHMESRLRVAEYWGCLCFNESFAIRDINRRKHEAIVEFVNSHNRQVPSDDQIESDVQGLASTVADAQKGAKTMVTARANLVAVAREVFRGSVDPLVQLQRVRPSLKALERNISPQLVAYFKNDVIGRHVFLGLDYRGVYLMQGDVAFKAIRNMYESVGFDADSGSDTEAITGAVDYFSELNPQFPEPDLPPPPLSPVDPYEPREPAELSGGGKARVAEMSAYSSLLGTKFDEADAYDEVRDIIAQYKQALAEHKAKVKSGYYDSDPTWQEYLRERAAYLSAFAQWKQEVEAILAPWRMKNEKLSQLWPTRKADILSELQKLRRQRTMMRVGMKQAELRYANMMKSESASPMPREDEPSITLVPDFTPFMRIEYRSAAADSRE